MPITPVTADDPEFKSADPVAANLVAMRALFPDAFTEGKADFDVLRQLLGDAVEDGDERYGLNWSGKRHARRLALTPSMGTLRPAKEESVDWDTTRNLMIEGDNLEVLKLLQKSYAGKVKLIYIDPPYNSGNDFIYPDDFADSLGNYLRRTGQVALSGARNTSNSEVSGRHHTNWLNMIYPRLLLAKSLLAVNGAIFINIGQVEHANISAIGKDLFGEENFFADICWQKKYAVSQDDPGIGSMHDNIVVFSKSREFRRNLLERDLKQLGRYSNPDQDARGPWAADNYIGNNSKAERPTLWYSIVHPRTGAPVWPKETAVWRYSQENHLKIEQEGRLYWGPTQNYERPRIKKFLSEIQDGVVPSTWWPFIEVGHNDEAQKETADILAPKVFSTPKPLRLLSRIIKLATDKDSIVMDFFAGSGSLGQAVLQQNTADGGSRRYILIQMPEPLNYSEKVQNVAADFCKSIGKPENIAELTKERLRRAAIVVRTEYAATAADLGFRVYKLALSNLKTWQPTADLRADLLSAADNLLPGRSEDDLLVELLLKRGIDLTEPQLTRIIAGREVHAFGGGVLVVCLANVETADAEVLADGIVDWIVDLAPVAPATVFFRDTGFENDVAKVNVDAILRQRLRDRGAGLPDLLDQVRSV